MKSPSALCPLSAPVTQSARSACVSPIRRCVAPNVTTHCWMRSLVSRQSAAARLVGSSAVGTRMGMGSFPPEKPRHPLRCCAAQENDRDSGRETILHCRQVRRACLPVPGTPPKASRCERQPGSDGSGLGSTWPHPAQCAWPQPLSPPCLENRPAFGL